MSRIGRTVSGAALGALAVACADTSAPAGGTTRVGAVEVTTAQATPLEVGETRTLAARVRAVDGTLIHDRDVAWTTGDGAVASVSTAGVVRAVGEGRASIAATVDGQRGEIEVVVVPRAVWSVDVAAPPAPISVGSTVTLAATPRARDGAPLTGRAVSWASGDAGIARVDAFGSVTAVRAGTTTIVATSEGRAGSAAVVVVAPTPAPVASVQVAPSALTLEPSESATIVATLRDADGNVLAGRTVTWTTDDSTTIMLGANGYVLGLRGGVARVTATSEGRSAFVIVRVPEWLDMSLTSLDAAPLPVQVGSRLLRDSTGAVYATRYDRVALGTLRLSTLDPSYTQQLTIDTWERRCTESLGDVICSAEQTRVGSRTIDDHGTTARIDVWTGELIYESAVFAGHTIQPHRFAAGKRSVRQRIPGVTTALHELVFTR